MAYHPLAPVKTLAVVELLRAGKSEREIVRRTGVARMTVRGISARLAAGDPALLALKRPGALGIFAVSCLCRPAPAPAPEADSPAWLVLPVAITATRAITHKELLDGLARRAMLDACDGAPVDVPELDAVEAE